MFLEPISHTILNGLVRSLVTLICDTGNGFVVWGEPFHLTPSTQIRMDRLIDRLVFPSTYGRPAVKIRCGCESPALCFEMRCTCMY